jgi:RHS repeat-associated protein
MTVYVGNHYEVKDSVVTKYYFAGATRLTVRTGGTLSYLLGDHLGSSSVTTTASGVKTASALYKAFGETRYSSGALGTDYKFTGQREEAALGIYYFNARWMDPSLGRFTSPDTIVPTGTQGTQAWDRYAYVNNNPVRYNDPTGHRACGDGEDIDCDGNKYAIEGSRSSCEGIDCGGESNRRRALRELEDRISYCANNIFSPQCQNMSVPSYEGFSEPDIIWAWSNFWSHLNTIALMNDAYELAGKGGWKWSSWALPTGAIEGTVAALAQGYKDSWYQSLTPGQRLGRMFVVGSEALLTDGASTLAGGTGALGGGIVGGPPGAAVGYGTGAIAVSAAGNKFWHDTVNPWLIPALGLGIWP